MPGLCALGASPAFGTGLRGRPGVGAPQHAFSRGLCQEGPHRLRRKLLVLQGQSESRPSADWLSAVLPVLPCSKRWWLQQSLPAAGSEPWICSGGPRPLARKAAPSVSTHFQARSTETAPSAATVRAFSLGECWSSDRVEAASAMSKSKQWQKALGMSVLIVESDFDSGQDALASLVL